MRLENHHAFTGYFLSLVLPFLSHLTRQSLSCSKIGTPFLYASFLLTYSISMVCLLPFVDTRGKYTLRIALVMFALTLLLSLQVRHVESLFYFAWSLHAIPSSLLWPFAFRFIHERSRHRIHLALWSLQGNVGDLVGCIYPLFQMTMDTKWILISTFMISSLLVSFLVARDVIIPEKEEDTLSSPLHSEGYHEKNRIPVPILLSLLLANTSLKSYTYFASTFLPSIQSVGANGYLLYNASTILGTFLSGVGFHLGVSYTSTCISSIIVILSLMLKGYIPSLPDLIPLLLFGCFTSLSSTMISICICSELSIRYHKYGKLTSILDSVGSIVSACILLVPEGYFLYLQWVCSTLLFVSTLLLSYLSHRLKLQSTPHRLW